MILKEISNSDVEWDEGPIRELVDINELVKLKAENIGLRNALIEKSKDLHSKEDEIFELKRKVDFLRGNIKYYVAEINRLDVFRASHDIKIPKHYQGVM